MVRTRAVLGLLLSLALVLSAAAPAAALADRWPAIGEKEEGFFLPALWRQILDLLHGLLPPREGAGALRPTLAADDGTPPPPPDPTPGSHGTMDPNG